MDPSAKKFPILSYILNRSFSKPKSIDPFDVDIEQPPILLPQDRTFETNLIIKDPQMLAAMKEAVTDVVQTRSKLQSLGPRPDHEEVDAAKAKLAEVEDHDEKEKLTALVSLEEDHIEYQRLLREAEVKLQRIYDTRYTATEESTAPETEEMNEEVVMVLQEGTAKGLEKVHLSRKKLRILPEAFGKIQGLVVLDVSDNQLKVIPDSIAGLLKLEELNVASNLLESLPDSLGLLQNLKILNASGNKLVALPDSISFCRSLVELDVSFNNLTYLPTNIGKELGNLQKLSVQLNKIRSLPLSVGEMASLVRLDARFNELRGLPITIGKLKNLEYMNLSNNFADLKELPETFSEMNSLKELDLSNNQLRALPDTFGLLENLTILNVDQNPLEIPPEEVVKEGVAAVKQYMAQRRLDMLLEEEEKISQEILMREQVAESGWLWRGASWVKNTVFGVTGYVTGYLGNVGYTGDPVIDEQR